MKEFIGSQEAKLYSKLHLLGEEKRFIETPIKDRIKRKPITLTIEPPPPQEGEFDDAEEDEINITIETNNTFSGLLGDMIDDLIEETLNHRKSTALSSESILTQNNNILIPYPIQYIQTKRGRKPK